MRFCH